jgi:hypothetical protein
MVRNFVSNCDLCGREIPFGRQMRRNVSPNGMEILMVALENSDTDLEFVENADGTLGFDSCPDCYTRVAFRHSSLVN